jgi:hypothetical protein
MGGGDVEERPAFVLGAGATKEWGGPLTHDILPAALNGEMAVLSMLCLWAASGLGIGGWDGDSLTRSRRA